MRERTVKPEQLSPLGQAAVKYASLGWAVIPLHSIQDGPDGPMCTCGRQDCHSPGKHPRTPHGVKDASKEKTQIVEWWTRWPDANVGIATGKASGVWVLDVDGPEGVESMKTLVEIYGKLPRTPRQKTGKGYHILFAYPSKIREVKNRVRVAPGLDIRGDGGYIVAAPSLHISGNRYQWVSGATTPLAFPPSWLLDALEGKDVYAEAREKDNPKSPSIIVDGDEILNGVPEGQRDDTLFRYAAKLRAKGVSRREAEVLILTAAKNCTPPFPEKEALAKIEQAWKYPGPQVGGEGDSRPILLLTSSRPHNIIEAVKILKEQKVPIYIRGGTLVRPVLETRDVGDQRIMMVKPITPQWLIRTIETVAQVSKLSPTTGRLLNRAFPTYEANTILSDPDLDGWPPLDSVVQIPLLLPDGSWIGENGYHHTRWGGFYLDLDSRPDIEWKEPGKTRDEAEEAVGGLLEHYRYMAWDSPTSKAVGISAILTAIYRPVIPSAPMHIFDAPTAGTGKSLLADSISIIATGHRAAVMNWTKDETENEKRVTAMLRAGDPIIVLDNVDVPINSASLAQVLTQEVKKARILGESREENIPCKAAIYATGNNVNVQGDMTRRVMVCRLDAKMEAPETRKIDQDLIKDTIQKRPLLVYWAQTIIRAYLLARAAGGLGDGTFRLPPLGSFYGWDVIRYALTWLGIGDPALSIETVRGFDPTRNEALAVFAAWYKVFGSQELSTSELATLAIEHPELRQALLHVAGKKGEINTRRLGYWLRGHRDARLSGYVLQAGPQVGATRTWKIIKER